MIQANIQRIFNYQSPSFLVKDLYESNQNKKEATVKYLNESLIDLKNFFNSKKNSRK